MYMTAPTSLFAALSDPTRLEALRLLSDGEEHCVCKLMKTLNVPQSRMSRHMGILKTAGLVVGRRDAQWVHYRITPSLPHSIAKLLEVALALPLSKESSV
jgi:ArsR family transcriptional regulator